MWTLRKLSSGLLKTEHWKARTQDGEKTMEKHSTREEPRSCGNCDKHMEELGTMAPLFPAA